MDIKERLRNLIELEYKATNAGFNELRHLLNVRDEEIGQLAYEYDVMFNTLIAILDYHDLNIDFTNDVAGHMCSLAIHAIREVKK